MRDEPIGAHIHLKLSVTSLRIPAKQTRLVFYEATADTAPAWFVLYANFSGFPQRNFNEPERSLELPHLVYILPKARWAATDVHVVSSRLQRDDKKMIVELENRGAQFGRLTGLEIRGTGRSLQIPGFPLFPGIRRRVRWTGTAMTSRPRSSSSRTTSHLNGRWCWTGDRWAAPAAALLPRGAARDDDGGVPAGRHRQRRGADLPRRRRIVVSVRC